jgi:hypothetical protein
MVHHIALPLQKDMNASIAEPSAFVSNRFHPLPKITIVGLCGLVSNCHAAAADGFTRPPFAHPEGVPQMGDSFPFGSGRHHFFPSKSFGATLSSVASASSRFSRAFSSSSVFDLALRGVAFAAMGAAGRTWPSICRCWHR